MNSKAYPEQTPELRETRHIRSQKTIQNEAELEQIRNTFIAILRDIRRIVEQQEPTTPELTRKNAAENGGFGCGEC